MDAHGPAKSHPAVCYIGDFDGAQKCGYHYLDCPYLLSYLASFADFRQAS